MARRLERCPLEYWFFYHLSCGGADPGADKNTRLLHRLKNLTFARNYPAVIKNSTVRKFFYHANIPEEPATATGNGFIPEEEYLEMRYGKMVSGVKKFARIFQSEYFFCKRDILNGDAWEDHGKILFYELYYRKEPPISFFAGLEEKLKSELNNLIALEIPQLLNSVPFHDRIIMNHPLEVEHLGKILRAAPAAAWREAEKTIYFFPSGMPSDETAVVCCLYAVYILRQRPDRVEFAAPQDGRIIRRRMTDIDISNSVSKINRDIDRMLETVKFFRKKPENCEKECIFKEFCVFF